MRREPLPFYPLVVAAFPVVSVYSANLAYVPASQIVRPLLLTVGAAAGLTLVLGLLLRDAARGAAAATVVAISFFGYAWFVAVAAKPFEGVLSPTAVWATATVALAALAAWRIRTARPLNVLATFIGIVALANLGFGLVRSARLAARAPRQGLGASAKAAEKPDVFYIVLDGHGRSDAIRRAIGYDNSPFVEGLKKRGFYVAEGSHSNYCQTELSLSSSLNMDLVPHLLPKVGPETEDRTPLAGLIDENEVARLFRAQGYRFLAVTSGFPPVRFTSADLQLGTRWGGTMVESTLVQMTPLARGDTVGSMFDARRKNLVGAFENVASLAPPTPQPRFVMVHILAPHPPFVFDRDGNALPHKGVYGFWDGDDYMTYVGTHEEYRKGYAGQVEWVERQTLATIDRLLAGSGGRRPVVIVQGDHGSKLHLAQNSLDGTDLHECFPILNAYLVPEAVRKDLYPTITPVNSFRVLLHGLFGDALPRLPDRSWYSRYATPYAFTDVTSRIEPVRQPM